MGDDLIQFVQKGSVSQAQDHLLAEIISLKTRSMARMTERPRPENFICNLTVYLLGITSGLNLYVFYVHNFFNT